MKGRILGDRYWLQLCRNAEKLESARLGWGELGIEHEGGVVLFGKDHSVAGEGGELGEERAEAVDGEAVFGLPGGGFGFGDAGTLGRGDDGAPLGLSGWLVIIVEEDRGQLLPQVPFEVIGQHAE